MENCNETKTVTKSTVLGGLTMPPPLIVADQERPRNENKNEKLMEKRSSFPIFPFRPLSASPLSPAHVLQAPMKTRQHARTHTTNLFIAEFFHSFCSLNSFISQQKKHQLHTHTTSVYVQVHTYTHKNTTCP